MDFVFWCSNYGAGQQVELERTVPGRTHFAATMPSENGDPRSENAQVNVRCSEQTGGDLAWLRGPRVWGVGGWMSTRTGNQLSVPSVE